MRRFFYFTTLVLTATLISCFRETNVNEVVNIKSVLLPSSVFFAPDSADWNDSVKIFWSDFLKTYFPKVKLKIFNFKVFIQDSLAKILYYDSTILIVQVPNVSFKPSRIKIVAEDKEFLISKFLYIYFKQGLLWLEKTRTKPGDILELNWGRFITNLQLSSFPNQEPKIKVGDSIAKVVRVTPYFVHFIVPNLPPGFYKCSLEFLDKKIKLTDSLIVYDPPVYWENVLLNSKIIEITLKIPVLFSNEKGENIPNYMHDAYFNSNDEFPVRYKLYKTANNKYSFSYKLESSEIIYETVLITIDTTVIPYTLNFYLYLATHKSYSVPGRTFYNYNISRSRKFEFVAIPFNITNNQLISEISGLGWSKNINIKIYDSETKTVSTSGESYTVTTLTNYTFNPESWTNEHKIILKIY